MYFDLERQSSYIHWHHIHYTLAVVESKALVLQKLLPEYISLQMEESFLFVGNDL